MTPASLTPRQIVAELDRYIVGQKAAKRAVAIALRNRWRRQHVAPELRDEIAPKNLILIGPTGVGKTEIARRLAKLVAAPFVKVEASKYTEVGYVGRDVESMVRDLVEAAIGLVRGEETERVKAAAIEATEEKLLEGLAPQIAEERAKRGLATGSRDLLRDELRAGRHDERTIEVEVSDAPATPSMQLFGPQGMEELGMNLQELFGQFGGGAAPRGRKRKATVAEARRLLEQDETRRRVDPERVKREAVRRAEESGIIFLDEIDKIAGPRGQSAGPDVSREGVQRDLLPIVEGSTVPTKYGPVKTDHVLFIAAGAFHVSKPSDLIPELQGRFPIRVELESLRRDDFVRILKEPRSSLLRQCEALLLTEGVELTFTDDAVEELARIAQLANERSENIGARRLHTVLERVLDEVSFEASELPPGHAIRVDAAYVKQKLDGLFASEDLSRFIL